MHRHDIEDARHHPCGEERVMSFKPRYILAQEAEERIVALYRKERGDAAEIYNTAIDACQTIILDMYDNSSEDVVPVVRCKECKHYREGKVLSPQKFCFRLRGRDGEAIGYNFAEDDFCSYGERSEDATD